MDYFFFVDIGQFNEAIYLSDKRKISMNTLLERESIPSTRYQGSKRKLLPWLYKHISPLEFDSVLDVFGGTGSVSYLFKKMGKEVTYNDNLKFNYYIGCSLIENKNIRLTEQDVDYLATRHGTVRYTDIVQKNFSDIYYTDEENAWVDRFLGNWNNLDNIYPKEIILYKKALAFSAFSQSALKKRPFNLFHRANLYMRFKKIKRSFGNKTSWDGMFEDYFRCFCKEINEHVFSNGRKNISIREDASELNNKKAYDLIYVDPPYIRKEASGSDVDYYKFYHFLEGACENGTWIDRIDYNSKNRCLINPKKNEWISPRHNYDAFESLVETFKNSIIVISYKEPGIPSKTKLIRLMKKYKKRVIVTHGIKYDYALNKNNGFHKEYLLIGLNK